MLEVYRAAADLQRRLQERGWRFCLIGGLALQRWGEPRETIDVDVTLLTGFGGEESFVREILTWYEPRVADPAGFACENRVLLVRDSRAAGTHAERRLTATRPLIHLTDRPNRYSPGDADVTNLHGQGVILESDRADLQRVPFARGLGRVFPRSDPVTHAAT